MVIDLPNAGPAFAAQDSEAPALERSFLDPETGDMVMLQSHSFIDRAEQLLHVEWIYDIIDGDGAVKRLFAPHKLRYFFLAELRAAFGTLRSWAGGSLRRYRPRGIHMRKRTHDRLCQCGLSA